MRYLLKKNCRKADNLLGKALFLKKQFYTMVIISALVVLQVKEKRAKNQKYLFPTVCVN